MKSKTILSTEPRIESWRNAFGDYLFEAGVRLIKISDVVRSKSDEMNAIIEIQSGNIHLYQSRINLLSSSQQEAMLRTLRRRDQFSGWEAILHLCFIHVLKSESKARDFVLIDEVPPGESCSFAVDPLLQADTVTVLAGDGGSAKSLFALALGMMILSGNELVPGLIPRRMGTVLYLDYEDSQEEISWRYHALKSGFGKEKIGSGLYYQRMISPIAIVKQDLLRVVQRYEPELIIVDSFSMACGGEPEKADSAIRVFDTLRALKRTTLLITHIAKAEQGLRRPNPYGSIHVVTQARSVLIQKRTDDEESDEIVFTIRNTKNNRQRRGQVWGFRLRFEEHSICLNRVHSSDPSLLDGMTLAQQIRTLLKRPMTTQEIADELNSSVNGIKTALYRMRRKGLIAMTDAGWALVEKN